jgi:N-acetylneuraminic acid mutarotase
LASPATSAPAPHRLLVRPARFRLPAPLAREAVVGAGCRAIVAGGLVDGDSSTATASRIDLRSGRVSPLPPLTVPVHDTAGVTAARPLVIGGGNAAEQSVVQAWDGAGWRVVGHLPQARSDLVAAVVTGRVVVAGGYDGARPAEPDILDSADGGAWRVDGVLPVPVRYPASAVVGGTIWLFGGESAGVTRSAIQRIDPATGRARLVGRLPRALGHAVAMPFGPRILIAGGRTAANAVSDRLWWFDTRTAAVTAAGRLPHPLADSALARCAGTDYLLGGETPALTDRVLRVTYR